MGWFTYINQLFGENGDLLVWCQFRTQSVTFIASFTKVCKGLLISLNNLPRVFCSKFNVFCSSSSRVIVSREILSNRWKRWFSKWGTSWVKIVDKSWSCKPWNVTVKLIIVTKLYTDGEKWGLSISVDMYNLKHKKGTRYSKDAQRKNMKHLFNNGKNTSLGSKQDSFLVLFQPSTQVGSQFILCEYICYLWL